MGTNKNVSYVMREGFRVINTALQRFIYQRKRQAILYAKIGYILYF